MILGSPVFVSLTLLLFATSVLTKDGDVSNGWGDQIDWKPFEQSQELAKKLNKPLMLILHKSWCGACKALKPQFVESKSIAELSENFVMVNAVDDEPPHGIKDFEVDGQYIPRIYFLRPDGQLIEEAVNKKGNPKYKYFHYSSTSIADTMRNVLDKLLFETQPKPPATETTPEAETPQRRERGDKVQDETSDATKVEL